jgi:hypothetical protein
MLAAKKGGPGKGKGTEDDDAGDDDADEDSEDDAPKGKEKVTKLSAEETDAIELANATAESAEARVFELSRQLQVANAQREVDGFLGRGLAPSIVDLARPVLELDPQVIELANGDTVDPGDVLRAVLAEVIELGESGHALIDLARESGSLQGTDEDVARRTEMLAIMARESATIY